MDDTQVGWIAAIIIGGVAGWLAEQFMKSEMGLLMNIVLGIIGAAVASAILSFLGSTSGGWLGYLIAGFIGAVLLIWIVRQVQAGRFEEGRVTRPRPLQRARSLAQRNRVLMLGRPRWMALEVLGDRATRARLRRDRRDTATRSEQTSETDVPGRGWSRKKAAVFN